MIDESTLRVKAREAIRTGTLPIHRPNHVWGGPGDDSDCPVCGQPVTTEEIGFELEFGQQAVGNRPGHHPLHVRCFTAWDEERQQQSTAAPREQFETMSDSRSLAREPTEPD